MSAPPFAIAIVSVSTGQSVLLPSVQSGGSLARKLLECCECHSPLGKKGRGVKSMSGALSDRYGAVHSEGARIGYQSPSHVRIAFGFLGKRLVKGFAIFDEGHKSVNADCSMGRQMGKTR
jgi:hypothetical protein